MPNLITDIKAAIAERARAEGFDVVRFTGTEAAARNHQGLEAYLRAGHHGSMEWMESR